MKSTAKKKSATNTKDKIIDATLKVIVDQGLVGISARNIAKVGDFNQALIFYHFDSINNLLLTSVQRASKARFDRYRTELESVSSLVEFAKLSNKVRAKKGEPDSAALAILAAGWSTNSELPEKLKEALKPWDDAVKNIVERIIEGTSISAIMPSDQIAQMISALFLGLEMNSRLDKTDEKFVEIFESLETLAGFGDLLLKKQD